MCYIAGIFIVVKFTQGALITKTITTHTLHYHYHHSHTLLSLSPLTHSAITITITTHTLHYYHLQSASVTYWDHVLCHPCTCALINLTI